MKKQDLESETVYRCAQLESSMPHVYVERVAVHVSTLIDFVGEKSFATYQAFLWRDVQLECGNSLIPPRCCSSSLPVSGTTD